MRTHAWRSAQAEDVQQYLRCGITDVIAKPIRRKELMVMLQKWLPSNAGPDVGSVAGDSVRLPAPGLAARSAAGDA